MSEMSDFSVRNDVNHKNSNKSSAVAEIGEPLATIDMGRKLGDAPFLGRGSWVPVQHNAAWAEVYLRTKWHLDPSSHLAVTDMGQKVEGCAPF